MQRSLGSGVIVDAAGLVVTNNHVIEGADQVKVSLADKREFEAEIVLKDPRTDLAVLRLKDAKERFPALEFANSDELQVGDVVLAIGNPFGVGQTVTHGIVSALARTQVGITDYQFFIQTDAAINPGNSGGALVDLGGQAGRHQHRDLLALRRLAGHRLRHSGQHGARRGRLRQGRRQRGASGRGSARKLQAVTPEIAESLGLEAAGRRAGRERGAGEPGGAGRAEDRRPDRRRSTARRSTIPNAFDYRFATKPLGGSAQLGVHARRQGACRCAVALEAAPDTAARGVVITAPLAVPGRQGRQPLAGAGR